LFGKHDDTYATQRRRNHICATTTTRCLTRDSNDGGETRRGRRILGRTCVCGSCQMKNRRTTKKKKLTFSHNGCHHVLAVTATCAHSGNDERTDHKTANRAHKGETDMTQAMMRCFLAVSPPNGTNKSSVPVKSHSYATPGKVLTVLSDTPDATARLTMQNMCNRPTKGEARRRANACTRSYQRLWPAWDVLPSARLMQYFLLTTFLEAVRCNANRWKAV